MDVLFVTALSVITPDITNAMLANGQINFYVQDPFYCKFAHQFFFLHVKQPWLERHQLFAGRAQDDFKIHRYPPS
jgi:hypothetical protein